MQQIRTRWHKFVAAVNAGNSVFMNDTEGDTYGCKTISEFGATDEGIANFRDALDTLPKFVIDPELFKIVSPENISASVHDLHTAGLLHLPYEQMVVEIPNVENSGTCDAAFVYLQEINHAGITDFCAMVCYFVKGKNECEYAMFCPAVFYFIPKIAEDGHVGMEFTCTRARELFGAENPHDGKQANSLFEGSTMTIVHQAHTAAILLMRTSGVAKEVIDVPKLNRKRNADGKVSIPKHTYIHISKVYRSVGDDVGEDYVPRKSPRPHWRKGHLRTVHFGVNREKIKQVYINPKLVALARDALVEPDAPSYVVTK